MELKEEEVPALMNVSEEETTDYSSLTVVELKSLAENRGITLNSSMKKADIIEKLLEGGA